MQSQLMRTVSSSSSKRRSNSDGKKSGRRGKRPRTSPVEAFSGKNLSARKLFTNGGNKE